MLKRMPTGEPGTPEEDAAPGDLSSYWGQQIAFNQLIRMGALAKQGNGRYGAVNGYTMGRCRSWWISFPALMLPPRFVRVGQLQ